MEKTKIVSGYEQGNMWRSTHRGIHISGAWDGQKKGDPNEKAALVELWLMHDGAKLTDELSESS